MLVPPHWLRERLGAPGLAVVDLRWREDGSGGARYENGHIPGAVHLDWATDLAEPDARFAFMLAGPDRFRDVMERAGIGDGGEVVAYADDRGSGPFRLWWAARVYGHPDAVRVLDGGLEAWLTAGLPLELGPVTPERARFTPRQGEGFIATGADVLAAERDEEVAVLDSRPPEQFRGAAVWFETGPVPAGANGVARTPRGDLRAGHVPWARNIPWDSLYRDDGTMKQPEELRAILTAAGVEPGTRAITMCGVGISAAALLYALERAGVRDVRLYDASWDEWGRDPNLPVARD